MNSRALFIALIVFLSCRNKNISDEIIWSNPNFDFKISKSIALSPLSGSSVPDFRYQNHVCGIAHINESKPVNPHYSYYRCHAYLDWNALSIDIGMNTVFGGFGFMIDYIDKKFSTKPYSWNHISIPETKYIIIKQDLILDKMKYKQGDSLFGKIFFHILEEFHGEKKERISQGVFRCKIDTAEYIWQDGKKFILMSH